MRNLSFLAAAFLAVASACTPNHGKCVINGVICDSLAVADGACIVLSGSDGEIARESVKDGRFRIVAPADETRICYLDLSVPGHQGDSGFEMGVVCEPCELSVDLDNGTVTGGPVSEALNQLQKDLMSCYQAAQEAYSKAYFAGHYALADSLAEAQMARMYSLCAEAYDANCDNVAGLQALTFLLDDESLSYADAEALVSKAADFIRNDEKVTRIMDAIKAAESTGVGSRFIDFEGKDRDGNALRLSDYVGKGKYVLIDFWASWCGPCMQAVPVVRSLQEKYGDKGFQLVGINCWERKAEDGPAKAALMDMTWPVIYAEDESVEAYGVQAIPTLIMFDPEGMIVERFLGEQGLEEGVAKYFE